MNCSPATPAFATFRAWSGLPDSGVLAIDPARGRWRSVFAHSLQTRTRTENWLRSRSGEGDVIHPYFLSRALFTAETAEYLLASRRRGVLARANAPLQESLRRTRDFDPINRVSYLEARCYMLNTLLRDADVMSMAHGLEVRVPFIDHQLAEKMFALPGAWKLDGNVPKPLLVGALNGALPDEIVHRKKRGFTLPFEQWLRENLRPEVEATLQRIGQGPLGSVLESRFRPAGLG